MICPLYFHLFSHSKAEGNYALVAVAATAAAVATGLVNDKAYSLALLNVIEANHADKAVAVLRAASLNFVQNCTSARCAK